jgi:hypothetical protein
MGDTRTKRIETFKWAPLFGKWEQAGNALTYTGQPTPKDFGILLSDVRTRRGTAEVTLNVGDSTSSGRVLLGYSARTQQCVTAGLVAYGAAYFFDTFSLREGWRALTTSGQDSNITPGRDYRLRVTFAGERLDLFVDGIQVLTHHLAEPLEGEQLGLFGYGPGSVTFSALSVEVQRPKAFVVMQFGDRYDSLWKEVIEKVAEDAGFEPIRADDVFKPGIVLQDIIQEIATSEVVIAEITPANPNVFYELGYAHALGKATILLAERNNKDLPFDIRSYRVIFYDDTIAGKTGVETALRKHLANVALATASASP